LTNPAAALVASVIFASPFLIRSHEWDRWYFLTVAASLGLLWMVLSGRRPFVRGNRFFGGLGVRLILVAVLAGVAVEAWFRTDGSHRTLLYQRYGDLPFAPLPDQFYVEKISQTASRTDRYGMRVTPFTGADSGRREILCLGDSITYGYGLPDNETYPAQLQEFLDKQYPGAWRVHNGGVNAYPMSFIRARFLQLWERGLRPEVVLIGYSMNESWLSTIVDADEATRRSFDFRVRAKNLIRQSAAYNVVMENWARVYYDRIKLHLVPGTHDVQQPLEALGAAYDRTLAQMVEDLRSRGVKPVFVAFASLNGETRRIDTGGPLQQRFLAFAERHSIPVLRTDEILIRVSGRQNLSGLFLDAAHMNPAGARLFAREAALAIPIRQQEP
jgi:lysophospholipase L1-like esterase